MIVVSFPPGNGRQKAFAGFVVALFLFLSRPFHQQQNIQGPPYPSEIDPIDTIDSYIVVLLLLLFKMELIPDNMKLSEIDDHARATSKFVGAFACHSYKEGLKAPLLTDDQAHKVRRASEKLLKQSGSYELFRGASNPKVTGLRHTQIELDECIGKGSFSEIYTVKSFRKLEKGQKLAAQKCVVKILQAKFVRKPALLAKRAADLAKDGLILASLDHPHILHVQGWPPTLLTGFEHTGRHDSFFLVLEKLQLTLDKRMDIWKKKTKSLNYAITHRGSKKASFWLDRLKVALHIADALQYLHDQRILHRDLKPENIGFDLAGVTKLYDFDVARVLPDEALFDVDAVFTLTQNVGSLRYMSPECGLGLQYNRKADVYSFSLLLHELMTLEKPYHHLKSYDHEHDVFQLGTRPIIPNEWPSALRLLVQEGWTRDPMQRPNMHQVSDVLGNLVQGIENDNSNTKGKGWSIPFVGKGVPDVPPSPAPPPKKSMALKMGSSTPKLNKSKVIADHPSLSTLDL